MMPETDIRKISMPRKPLINWLASAGLELLDRLFFFMGTRTIMRARQAGYPACRHCGSESEVRCAQVVGALQAQRELGSVVSSRVALHDGVFDPVAHLVADHQLGGRGHGPGGNRERLVAGGACVGVDPAQVELVARLE